MKNVILSAGLALSVLAAPAFANTSGSAETATSVEVETLSGEQLDALVSILSGLPRQ